MNESAREKARSLITNLQKFEKEWCHNRDYCFDGFNLMLLQVRQNSDLITDFERDTGDEETKVFLDEIKDAVALALKQLVSVYGSRSKVRDWFDVLRGKLKADELRSHRCTAQIVWYQHSERHFPIDQLTTGDFFSALPQSIQEVLNPDKNFPQAGLILARQRAERRDEKIAKDQVRRAKEKVRDFLRRNPYVDNDQFVEMLARHDLSALLGLRAEIVKLPMPLSGKIAQVFNALNKVIRDFYRRQKEEQEAQQAEIQRNQEEAKQKRAQFELWKEKIAGRCRQIVSVFNGIFDFAIDSDALLSGEINGEYASIHSVAPSGGGMGLHQELRQALELRYCTGDERTWLEIEAGGNETEWQAAYDSENFLVWHELAHLVDKDVIERCIDSVVSAESKESLLGGGYGVIIENDEDLIRKQAREVVIDAIAMNLGEAFYVHSDKTRFVATQLGRKINMLKSYLVLANRILRSCDDGNQFLICRLLGVIAVSGELDDVVKAVESDEIVKTRINYLCDWFRSNRLVEFYSSLYRRALGINVTRIEFRPSLIEEDGESENVVGAEKVANL